MLKNFTVLIVLILMSGCSEEKDVFLERFRELNKIPTSESMAAIKLTDTISLKAINEIFLEDVNGGYTIKFAPKKYYYIGKYKLKDNCYIVGYSAVSSPMDDSSNVIAIYDVKQRRITSKLVIGSTEPVRITSSYKKGIFYIKSKYVYIPSGKEASAW